jgi:DNA gyrase/topoisomerase IV subunit A
MTKDSEKTTVDTLLEITKRDLKTYGQDVVEQRAVPDYRDGLKPVHRFILWACYGLGLKYGTPFKKAARTVGETIGKFSPHGDQATYDAMVLMAGVRSEDGKSWTSKNSSVPLIEGYGNWGDNVDNAAAMRYTEARLSEFSTKYILDPIYLAVSDYRYHSGCQLVV